MREMKQRTIEEETKWGVRVCVWGRECEKEGNAVRRMEKL
jgi:hypothetical protein